MALVIAALAAEGVSTIANVGQIDRGYEGLEQKLKLLGLISNDAEHPRP